MKRGIFLALALMGAALAACEGDASKPSSGPSTIADADLAVPADFQEEAEARITPANYKTELEALDKEIDSK